MTQKTTTLEIPKLTVEESNEIATLVDEMGGISDQVAAAKKLVAKYDAMRKKLVALAAETVAPEEPIEAIGEYYVADITEQRKQRDVINKAAIFEAIGNDAFVALAQFKVTDLDKHLTPKQIEKAVATVNAGPRRLTIRKKGE
jgi:hypothetical protein